MRYFILVLLFNFFWSNYGQKNNSVCKSDNKADSCMQKLLLLGDPKFTFPEGKAEMNSHCRVITTHEKCIKEYSTKCLASFPRQVTSVLAYGVAKTNKGYCANQKRKDSFISIGKCGNKLKPAGDKCMRNYVDQLLGIENYQENKMKIPLACCNYYLLKECILNEVEKEGAPHCTQTQYTEIERIVDGYAYDVLQLLCGDYTEDSDKCEKLVQKTPKRLSSQRRPKSLLPPFIAILGTD